MNRKLRFNDFLLKAATEEACLEKKASKTASPPAPFQGSLSISTHPEFQSQPGGSAPASLHLIGVSLVSVDKEASEEAVGPVRVIEESVLL